MILDKKITIKVHTKNRSKYKDNKIGDLIDIDVLELSKGSSIKINVECDNCSSTKKISFHDYVKATNDFKRPYYCRKCSHIHTKNTIKEKYGVENIMHVSDIKDKHKKSISNIDFKKADTKRKRTNSIKYGVEYVQQNKDINQKTKKSTKLKYKVDYVFHTNENREKSILKSKSVESLEKRNKSLHNKIVSKIEEKYNLKIDKYDGKLFTIKCDKGHFYEIDDTLLVNRNNLNTKFCTICNPISNLDSNSERVLKEFLVNLNIEYISNDRTVLNGKELDIYIPKYNLAIEFNGLYWHSEFYKDKRYHLDKTLMCQEKGIKLLHIWEDDWLYKNDIIKSIIKNRLNKIDSIIYARKCEIKEVASNIAKKFLEENHIQGFAMSKYKLGLYYQNELVSLMTFGYRKTNSKKEFELIRFCNIINTNVIGASSKLFKHFVSNYMLEGSYVISYADISLFDGNMYDMVGFKEIHLSKPNYYWVVNGKRYHRWSYNKQKLIKEGYSKDKTEVEVMHERGYYRVFSCGQKRYEYYNG